MKFQITVATLATILSASALTGQEALGRTCNEDSKSFEIEAKRWNS